MNIQPHSDLLSQAVTLHRAGKLAEAEALYRMLLAQDSRHADALTLLGTITAQRGQYAEGVETITAAIAANPHHVDAYFNRALAQQMLGRYEAALADYDKAATLDPDYAEAVWHKSLILLTLGRYEEGWKLYESRWKTRSPRQFPVPLWSGQPGVKLLVHAEQGYGDTLQFCRYLPLIAERNTVVFECPSSLVSFMRHNFPQVEVIASAQAAMEGESAVAYHIPLLSLPGVLGTRLESIPSAPYLAAEPACVKQWRARLSEWRQSAADALCIGLCWAGGQRPDLPESMRVDARRSLHFTQFAPLLEIPRAAFLSLQLGPPARERNDERIKDVSGSIESWSDTAAIISLLDLVISVDTAVCHLAAAMGKRVFLLNRYDTCWRWLLGREDSPWYPTLRQFRQETPGDWPAVIQKVKRAVEREMSPA